MSDSPIVRPFPAHLFTDFSKRELQQVLEIMHYCLTAKTNQNIQHAMSLSARILPCNMIVLAGGPLTPVGVDPTSSNIINVSFPMAWLERYLTNNYIAIDPVAKHWFQTGATTVWDRTIKTTHLPSEQQFMEEADSFGVSTGIITGVRDAQRKDGSFIAFAGGKTRDIVRYKPMTDYIASCLHEAIVNNRERKTPPRSPNAPELTAHEEAILVLLAEGKTTWDISRLLEKNERTVRFHIEKLLTKLDATNRAQAIAIAYQFGLVQTPVSDLA